jgi:hypothetical protein
MFRVIYSKAKHILQPWIRKLALNWRRVLLVLSSGIMVLIGYRLMRQGPTDPVSLYSIEDIALSESSPVGERKGRGRLKSIDLRHIYSEESNQIQVSIDLEKGESEGAVMLDFSHPTEIVAESLKTSIGKISAHHHVFLRNAVVIRYNSETDLHLEYIISVKIPSLNLPKLGRATFQFPNESGLRASEFTCSYSLHPPSDATVSVAGTQGEAAAGTVGWVWKDCSSVIHGTTVSITTPRTEKHAQELMALGAILIAIGVNLLTSFLDNWFRLMPRLDVEKIRT